MLFFDSTIHRTHLASECGVVASLSLFGPIVIDAFKLSSM